MRGRATRLLFQDYLNALPRPLQTRAMYTGHIGAALFALSLSEQIPVLPTLLATAWLDLLDGLFMALGISRATPNPLAGPYLFADLDFIDWDHSALMAVIWSALYGLVFAGRGKKATIALAAVSLSHWVLDWCVRSLLFRFELTRMARMVHNSDLAAYPHSSLHFGAGLWARWGTYAWVGEGVLTFFFAALAFAFATPDRKRNWRSIAVTLLVLHLQLSPWTSPMKQMGKIEEPLRHRLAAVALIAAFVLPSIWLAKLMEPTRARMKEM